MVKIQFEKLVLPNGLAVILHVDRSSPLVAVNLWYHVGSKDEVPGRTGFAHLFEHLMFMGSKNAPYPAFDAIMESWGGHNNGTTSNDRTNYYEIGPRNLLETFLWLEADRLATLRIDKDTFANEREVVKEERRMRVDNQPYGRLNEIIYEQAFTTHPYKHATIGSMEDLEAASVEDVRDFYRTFYVPANATLVIVGDFDKAQALQLVNNYMGRVPKSDRAGGAAGSPARDTIALTDRAAAAPRLSGIRRPCSRRGRRPGHGGARPGWRQVQPLYRSLVRKSGSAGRVCVSSSQLLSSLFQVGVTPNPATTDDGAASVEIRLVAKAHRGSCARAQHAPGRLRQSRPPADAGRSAQSLPARARRSRRRARDVGRQQNHDASARSSRVSSRTVSICDLPEPSPRMTGDRLIETPAAMAQAPSVGRCRRSPALATRWLSTGLEVVALRRDGPIVGVVHVPERRSLDPPGAPAWRRHRRDARRGRGGATRWDRGRPGAARRRSRLASAATARSCRCRRCGDVPRRDGDRRRHSRAPAARGDRLAAGSQRPAHGRRAAPRSTGGGRERRLRSHAVRRHPSLRGARRRAGANHRCDHARRRARVSRRSLSTQPRIAGRGGRLRRSDAAGRARSHAGGLAARAAATFAAPAAVAEPAAPGARRSPRPQSIVRLVAPTIASRPIDRGCRC
jgi:hypothetical protein